MLEVLNIKRGSINQGHLQNLFHVDVDVILMVGNVTRDKNGTIKSVSVSVKINNNACKEDDYV